MISFFRTLTNYYLMNLLVNRLNQIVSYFLSVMCLGVHFCSAVYPGLAPFSEPETETVARYLRKLKLAAYITIHSFFELWMYPYGYKESPSADHGELVSLAKNYHGYLFCKQYFYKFKRPVGILLNWYKIRLKRFRLKKTSVCAI